MTDQAAEFHFGSWSVPPIPFTIEYPLEVMDEIRAAVCEGLQQLSHGGLEVGGVLFGSRRENSIRILTWRPISCEHAQGPGLRLSARDRIDLVRLLEVAKTDPDLQGLQPVGWFLSHARSDIFLSASDLEVYNDFFPESWQVTLVLRPARTGLARGGFFVREEGGVLKADSSYKDFTVEPMAHPAPPRPTQSQPPRDLRVSEVRAEPPELALTRHDPGPQFLTERPRRTGGGWLWAIPACLVLLIAGLLIKQRLSPPSVQTFAFRVYNAGETAQLEWDQNSPPVRAAQRGLLEVRESGETKRYTLTAEQLKEGMMTYLRRSGDLELRFTVYPTGGAAVQESARLIGPADTTPPISAAAAADATSVLAERDELRDRVTALTEALRTEKARADRLQETVRILQNRIAVDAARGLLTDEKK